MVLPVMLLFMKGNLNQKAMPAGRQGFSNLVVIIIILLITVVIGGFYIFNKDKTQPPPETLTDTETPKPPETAMVKSSPIITTSQPKNAEEYLGDYLGNPMVTDRLQPCIGNVLFNDPPANLENIASIMPLGNINPSAGHVTPSDHTGVVLQRVNVPNSMETIKTDIQAPGNVHIFGVRKYFVKETGREEYAIAFSPCKEFTAYYGHVNFISTKLKQALEQTKFVQCDPNSQATCEYHLDYQAISGEVIGTAGGPGANTAGIDFGSFDLRTPELGFLNKDIQNYYITQKNKTLHTTCPYDYYPQPLKDKLYGKIPRVVEPRCGEFMQDKAGTIQGNWQLKDYIQQGSNDWDKYFSVIHDLFDSTIGIVAIGGRISTPGEFDFHPRHTGTINREPSEVTADGKIYCYQNEISNRNGILSGHVILKLTDSEMLQVEYQAGICGLDNNFTSSPTVYQR